MCKTVNSMGRGVGVGVGVDVGIGVGVLVGVEVGVEVEVDMIPLQPNKANPIKMKKPIRNKSLLLSNMISPDLIHLGVNLPTVPWLYAASPKATLRYGLRPTQGAS